MKIALNAQQLAATHSLSEILDIFDIEIQALEILRMRHELNTLYAKHAGKDLDVIERAMDRDKFMSAEEAKEFGLIDEVAEKRPLPTDSDALKAA